MINLPKINTFLEPIAVNEYLGVITFKKYECEECNNNSYGWYELGRVM